VALGGKRRDPSINTDEKINTMMPVTWSARRITPSAFPVRGEDHR